MFCVLSNEIVIGTYLLPNTLATTHCTSTTSRNSSCRIWKKGVLRACYLNKMCLRLCRFTIQFRREFLDRKLL